MDLKSLNSGSVGSKGWLTPVVGALTADNVGSSTFSTVDPVTNLINPVGGMVSASQTGFASPIYTLVSGTYTDVTTASATSGAIAPSKLVVGSTYEVYMAGRFTETPQSAGALVFYPSFSYILGTTANAMEEILIPFESLVGQKSFELRFTFRVIAFTDTTIQCQTAYTGITFGAQDSHPRVFVDPTPSTIPTMSRSSEGVLYFNIFSTATDMSLTRTQYYVRQVC